MRRSFADTPTVSVCRDGVSNDYANRAWRVYGEFSQFDLALTIIRSVSDTVSPRYSMTDQLENFIRELDKAELHIHIEGSLEPELMFELARLNDLSLEYDSVEELRAKYDFSNLQDFLDLYYAGLQVLRTEQDFYLLTRRYLEIVTLENVSAVELFFDPQAHTERGISFDTCIRGILRAAREFQNDDFSVSLIMCFLRHLTEADAFRVLEEAEPYRDAVLGVGLDSSELGHPPSKFRNVFDAARKQGYRLVAHAGEEGPPEYVWEALDELGVERIDHGNRALEDDALVQRLQTEKMALTMCPLSNLKLCVVDDLTEHPLKRMLDLGLNVTVNSDDPAYFGGYLSSNYMAVAKALQLSQDDLSELARNSLNSTFTT